MSHSHSACCSTEERRIFNIKKDLAFAILAGLFLLIGFLLEVFTETSFFLFFSVYAISYFFGGYYTVLHSVESLKEKKFDIDFSDDGSCYWCCEFRKICRRRIIIISFQFGSCFGKLCDG